MGKIGVGEVRLSSRAVANIAIALQNHRLSYGPFSREFESRFAQLHGKRFACFVNSGTSALQIGLGAMKEKYRWPDGSGVLVPALTFVATVNVVRQNRMTPVFVDVDRYYGMSRAGVLREIEERPYVVAILPAHLFGQTADPALLGLAKIAGLRVIADSCETVGVPRCADGDVSCFSTYACHLIQTGVGGLALTDDPELAALIRSLANHGRSGIYTSIDDELGSREVIDARFHFDREGYSYRATELEAAIGCAELDDWPMNLAARRRNAAYLLEALGDLPLELPQIRPTGEHSWMVFPVLAQDRDGLEAHLEANGIETRRMLPLTSQPYFKKLYGDIQDRFPMAKRVNDTGLYVGVHQYLTQDDLERISSAFHDFYR